MYHIILYKLAEEKNIDFIHFSQKKNTTVKNLSSLANK